VGGENACIHAPRPPNGGNFALSHAHKLPPSSFVEEENPRGREKQRTDADDGNGDPLPPLALRRVGRARCPDDARAVPNHPFSTPGQKKSSHFFMHFSRPRPTPRDLARDVCHPPHPDHRPEPHVSAVLFHRSVQNTSPRLYFAYLPLSLQLSVPLQRGGVNVPLSLTPAARSPSATPAPASALLLCPRPRRPRSGVCCPPKAQCVVVHFPRFCPLGRGRGRGSRLLFCLPPYLVLFSRTGFSLLAGSLTER